MSSTRDRVEKARAKGRQQADAWNEAHPIGTRVIAYPDCRPEYDAADAERTRLVTTTRTPAWILGHGEPIVSVHGYAGGIILEHVDIDDDSPLQDGELLAHVLTKQNLTRIDDWLDRIDVFAKSYWETVEGKLTVTGLRIGAGPGRVVAKFGDTIIRHADGRFSVRTAVEGGVR
ncbi:hypothetical protein ACIQKB_03900 [Streptomyces sp. NPDC092046]|uniref:hypothetical protein n=1 Tax=Streptomyces sp. NPDC092046 TaxID=3366009 RepID=UPI00381666D2